MRVLAFEDSYDIERLLDSGGVDVGVIEILQHWDTKSAVQRIRTYAPDILLLDHYIPPNKGLEVLRSLNKAVQYGELDRPPTIVGMSSASMANLKFSDEGADHSIIKFDLAKLEFWPRR
jgi:CheY-like chemotaxis protein